MAAKFTIKKERINEMWGVFCLLVGLFTLASLFFYKPDDLAFYTSHPKPPSNQSTGLIGSYLAFGLKFAFGDSAIWIPFFFLLWAVCFFTQRVPVRKSFKFIGLGISLVSTCVLIAILLDPELRFEHGGVVGYFAGTYLLSYFGPVGSIILAGACLLLSLLLATDFLIYPLIMDFAGTMRGILKGATEFFTAIYDFIGWIFRRKPPVAGSKKSMHNGSAKGGARSKSRGRMVDEEGEDEDEEDEEEPAFDRSAPIKVKRYLDDLPDPAESEKESKPKKSLASVLGNKKEGVKETGAKSPEAAASAVSSGDEKGDGHAGVLGSQSGPSNYQFPSFDFLRRPEKSELIPDNLQENSRILEDTLADFGIEVKVTEVEQGPVITRYELLPAPGVKVNSIAALSDDIALAMKAVSVRLIIPIPGKSAVGVEVPNSVASKVSLRELVESPVMKTKKFQLPLLLGKDTSGKALVGDLASMPHILIAGTTGSGKTVCVNSIILGLIYNLPPEDLKFVIVDPKMVEMAVYNKIPHMISPVVTDVRKAAHTLNWVVQEMENRYQLLAQVGVRNIQTFNTRPMSEEARAEVEGKDSPNVIPAKLPYIVVVIDELADLMMMAQDKVEAAITRLAQLSRAVGIHLILATQRPSVDVITGVIKANFPARISFKVASKVDSRTVLDANGADKLLGRGDMLFLQPGAEKPVRGQACFVGDDEINAVVKFVSEQAQPEYLPEIQAAQEGKTGNGAAGGERDELFEEAVRIVLQTGQASTSNLQRRLSLGYTRAARIIDQIEAAGIIGPAQGAKPREILVDRGVEQPLE